MKVPTNSSGIVPLKEGLKFIQEEGVDKIEKVLADRVPNSKIPKIFEINQFVELYTACHMMCTQRSPYEYSKELYEFYGDTIKNYLDKNVLPAIQKKTHQGGTKLLEEFVQQWSNYKIMTKYLVKIFVYLDRYFVRHKSRPSLWEASTNHFTEHVYNEIKSEVSTAILDLTTQEREGSNPIDEGLVQKVVEIYYILEKDCLDVYKTDIKKRYLVSCRTYYGHKRKEWLQSNKSAAEYLWKASEAFKGESCRTLKYFDPSFEANIAVVVEEELLEKVKFEQLKKNPPRTKNVDIHQDDDAQNLNQNLAELFRHMENNCDTSTGLAVKNFILSSTDIGSGDNATQDEVVESELFGRVLIGLQEGNLVVTKNHKPTSLNEPNDHLIQDETVEGKKTRIIMDLINKNRDGMSVESKLVTDMIENFKNMGIQSNSVNAYQTFVEEPLLASTVKYFSQKREEWLTCSVPKYVIKVENMLCEEQRRMAELLNLPSSENRIIKVVENELIDKAVEDVLDNETSGFMVLLQAEKGDDLQRIVRLLKSTPWSIYKMASRFEKYISSLAEDMIKHQNDSADSIRYTNAIIALHKRGVEVIQLWFSSDKKFKDALGRAFRMIVNNKSFGGHQTAVERMSAHCDNIVRQCEEVEGGTSNVAQRMRIANQLLDEFVPIIKYMNGNGQFIVGYCGRLVIHNKKHPRSGNNDSIDMKKLFISNMKKNFGWELFSQEKRIKIEHDGGIIKNNTSPSQQMQDKLQHQQHQQEKLPVICSEAKLQAKKHSNDNIDIENQVTQATPENDVKKIDPEKDCDKKKSIFHPVYNVSRTQNGIAIIMLILLMMTSGLFFLQARCAK